MLNKNTQRFDGEGFDEESKDYDSLCSQILIELEDLIQGKAADTIPIKVISAINDLQKISNNPSVDNQYKQESYLYALDAKELLEERLKNSQAVMLKKIYTVNIAITDLIKTRKHDELYKQAYNVTQELDLITDNPEQFREETILETYNYAVSIRNELDGMGGIQL